MKLLLAIALGVAVLALPALVKEKGHPPLVGPELADLAYTEVAFTNAVDNLELAGLLFVPQGSGPFPAAVIIHGSGTSRRDSVWYLSVTRHLQDNGIAVLLPDKRGSEESEGTWLGASFEELANDTLAAVDFLCMQDYIATSKIGIIGMSQGGWIAPIAASKTSWIEFVVSMSGATVTPEEQLLHEEIYNIEPYTYLSIAKAIAPLTARRLMRMEFFKPWADFDPIPYWQSTQVPVFLAFGDEDQNVPVETSIERLKSHDLDHHSIRVYADGGHAIRDPLTDQVSPAFLGDLVEFIQDSI